MEQARPALEHLPLSALSRVPEYENYAKDILPVRQHITGTRSFTSLPGH
jgi:hypothetical protein